MIGDIIYNDLNDDKRLPCTGNAYPEAAYPELAAICDKVPGTNIDLQSTVSGVPSLAGTGNGAAFSPDGQFLAVAHQNSPFLTVIRTSDWSVVIGTPVLSESGNGLDFSPDGQYLAVSTNSPPYVTIVKTSDWSVVNTNTLWASLVEVRKLKFSPNGKYLAVSVYASTSTGQNGLVVLDTTNWTIVEDSLLLNSGQAYGLDISPDSRFIAVAHRESPYNLKVVDVENWSLVPNIPQFSGTLSYNAQFSPDGEYLVFLGWHTEKVTVLRTRDWSIVTHLPLFNGYPRVAHFSPDGRYLSVGTSSDKYHVVVRCSDWTEVVDAPNVPAGVRGVRFSPDGAYLAAAHNVTPCLTIINVTQDAPTGYFHVPKIPMQKGINIDYPVLIQAED